MCGGFVLALGRGARPQALFHAGKTFTYAFLGAMAGALGASLREASQLAAAQEALAVLSGALLVVAGVRLLRPVFGPAPVPARAPGSTPIAISPRPGSLAEAWTAAVGISLRGGPFFAGLLAGFIPCGLVYAAALRAAATSSALDGALAMAIFGAGTVPSLVAVAALGGLVPARHRARLGALSGALVVTLGLVAIARGAVAMASPPGEVSCPACAAGSSPRS
jgi:hypothetical protein